MSSEDFHIEYKSNVPDFTDTLKAAAEKHLWGLADSHNDIDHATVAVTKSREGAGPEQFQARVIVNARPDNISVTKTDYLLVETIDEALADVERLIREKYQDWSEPTKGNELPNRCGD